MSGKILSKIKKYITWQLMAGIILGAAGGYAYYHFVGCRSGSCPITSNPANTIFYGILIGGLLGFRDKSKSKSEKSAD